MNYLQKFYKRRLGSFFAIMLFLSLVVFLYTPETKATVTSYSSEDRYVTVISIISPEQSSIHTSTRDNSSVLNFEVSLAGSNDTNIQIQMGFFRDGAQCSTNLTEGLKGQIIGLLNGDYIFAVSAYGNHSSDYKTVNFTIAIPTPSTETPVQLFTLESNSTVSNFNFNSTTFAYSFTVSGPNGTTGYIKSSVAKTLVPDFTGVTVTIDGKNLAFTIGNTTNYWIVEFTYSHSTHQIVMDLFDEAPDAPATQEATTTTKEPISTIPELTLFALFFGVLILIVSLAFTRKKHDPTRVVII